MPVETMQVPRQTSRLPGAEDMVARRVVYERRRREWSNAELAKRVTDAGCPINQSAIQKIEHGSPRRTISLDEALAFARVFGLTLDELRSMPNDPLVQPASAVERSMASAQDATEDLLEKLKVLQKRLEALRQAGDEPGSEAAERVFALVSEVEKMLSSKRDSAAEIIGRIRTGAQDKDADP